MPRRQRRSFDAGQKAAAVVRHLQDGVAVSTLCEELDIHPNQFHEWRRQALSNLAKVFERESKSELARLHAEMAAAKEKLAKKDEAIAELLQEYIDVKKNAGETWGGGGRGRSSGTRR
jgi:transposase-like protein